MQNPNNPNKYKIEVRNGRPLPKQKVTGINWDELVEVLHKNEISMAEKIRLHNVGQKHGTNHISGKVMLDLWKAVENKNKPKSTGIADPKKVK